MSIFDKSREEHQSYWQDRAERVILAAEKTQDEMLADLEKSYRAAQRKIQKEIETFHGRYATETGLSSEIIYKQLSGDALNDAKSQIQEYYDAVKEKDYLYDPAYRAQLRQLSAKAYMSRLEELQANIQWEIENLYAEQHQGLKEGLESTYEESYYRTTFNIQQAKGFGSPFAALNKPAIEKAVSVKWLDGRPRDNYSGRTWKNKDILMQALNQQIPQGFILGRNPRVIAKNILSMMPDDTTPYKTSLYNATRLARSEFNFIANAASTAAYKTAGVLQYEYLSTLDERTTKYICRPMDGKIFNVGEEKVGVNFPPLHVQCRSTTIPFFPPDEIDALFAKSERIARNPETGKNYSVPMDMKYSEWKEKHVSG